MSGTPAPMAWLLDRLKAHPAGVPPPPRIEDPAVQRELLTLIRHHRVAPSLPDAVVDDPSLPDALRRDLTALRRRRRVRLLRLAAEAGTVCASLDAAGVPNRLLKGMAASVLLHGGVGTRDALDADVLVPHGALPAVAAALAPLGYARSFGPEDGADNPRPPPVAVFRRTGAAGLVEIHTELADDHRLFPLERPFEASAEVHLGPHIVRSLPREACVVYAAFHGWKHFWGRLVWLTDMAAAARHPGMDWAGALGLARALGCERHLALGTLLARDLLGAPMPAPLAADASLLAKVRRPATLLMPLMAGAEILEGTAPAYRMGLFTTVLWDLRMHSRADAKLAALNRYLRPTADDRKMIQLPAPFYPLYYGLRVGRLLGRALPFRRGPP